MNSHSYPLFKSGHIQKIMTIKGNDNNVSLNAVCLPEMRKDRENKIQMVLSPSAEILYAEDGCAAGRGPRGSSKHIAAFCYALEEFVRLGFTRPFLSCTSRLQTWNQPWQKNYTPKPSTKYHLGGLSMERWRKHTLSHFHKTIMPSQWNIGANSLMRLWSWLICAGDCQSRVHFFKCWLLDKEQLHPFNKCPQQSQWI